MTFYEAAVEVLRVAGRPLHYKKITEIAIKRGLLSHIGKAPELTMGNRLNQEVRKDDGTNVVVRTRPGVFALRAWMDKGGLVPARVAETTGMARAILEGIEPEVGDIEELLRGDDPENPREPSARVAAVVVVPPVVASVLPSLVSDDAEEGEPEGEVEGEPEEERAERRRRRKRRRDGARPEEVSAFLREAEAAHEPVLGAGEGASVGSGEELGGEERGEPVGLGGIALAAWKVLREEPGRLLGEAELGERVFGQRLVRFHTLHREAAVRAALVTDNHQRRNRGWRPLFVATAGGAWGLSEWNLSERELRAEESLLRLAEVLRQEAEAQVGALLSRVGRAGLEHLILVLLERLGYRDLKVSKRLGDGGVVFTARLVRGLSEARVAVCLMGAERAVTEQDVSSLRGTLHHYGASEGVLLTLEEVSKEARAEGAAANLAPIGLLDRESVVRLLLEAGVGVRSFVVQVPVADRAFFEQLGLEA
jgi:hypothetical protein